jgi:hypothetical protein
MTLVKPPYHIGIVVPEIEQGMDELSQVLGLTWGKIQRRVNDVEMAGVVQPVEACFTYSLDGPPYLELIEQRVGSVWEKLGLHHIGVWTDDVPGESARLDSLEWPRESVSITPEGTWGGGLYHLGLGCLRLELVDIGRSGPRLVNYLGGGDYALPS